MKPSQSMQAFIVVVLLAFYGAALFLPAFLPVSLDEAMKQTLLNLVIAAVSYYIGTSAGSSKKDDTIAGLSQPVPPKE
jgi:hypothetical protein